MPPSPLPPFFTTRPDPEVQPQNTEARGIIHQLLFPQTSACNWMGGGWRIMPWFEHPSPIEDWWRRTKGLAHVAAVMERSLRRITRGHVTAGADWKAEGQKGNRLDSDCAFTQCRCSLPTVPRHVYTTPCCFVLQPRCPALFCLWPRRQQRCVAASELMRLSAGVSCRLPSSDSSWEDNFNIWNYSVAIFFSTSGKMHLILSNLPNAEWLYVQDIESDLHQVSWTVHHKDNKHSVFKKQSTKSPYIHSCSCVSWHFSDICK